MAPIKDETVDALKDLIHKLESRVEQLEAKLELKEGGPIARKTKSNTESIRLVLMGPPGAGMNLGSPACLDLPGTCVVNRLTRCL